MSSPALVTRRVSARRGSVTAPDPHGLHSDVNLNPARSSSSKLTIVRVPAPAAVTPLNLNEPPSSPVLGQRRLHRRIAPTATSPPERVSFAFSSFGGKERSASPDHSHHHHHGHGHSGGGGSPSSSPRLRPSSPHGHSSGSGFKPRLTPDQLVDLARQSTVPRPQALSPAIADAAGVPAPATFTPLPDDIYLPFIDRPSEVATLISSPPDVKLFTLLAQTFPKNLNAKPELFESKLQMDSPQNLPRDPATWNFQQLMYHLTHIDRDVSPDFVWAIAARKCILSHSELLWERIKGALGIPPELDVDYDFLDDDQESPDTSDISDDEGRAARGHWSDWDAVMDSPISVRPSKRLSMGDSPSASIYSGRQHHHDQEAHFRSQMDDKLQGLKKDGYTQTSASATRESDDDPGEPTIAAPTPHGLRSPSGAGEGGGMVIGDFSPLIDPGLSSPQDHIVIEPLLAPPATLSPHSSGSNNPPPLSLPASLGLMAGSPGEGAGLGDIAEGAEEEEEETEAATEVASPAPDTITESSSANGKPEEDPDLISPSQIQGLRISTSPLPASHSFGSPALLSPISPLPPYPSHPSGTSPIPGMSLDAAIGSGTSPNPPASAAQPIPSSSSHPSSSRPHSRTGSFSSIGGGSGFGPFQRSESTGSLSASWSAGNASSNIPNSAYSHQTTYSGYASSVVGSDIDMGDLSSGYVSDGGSSVGFGLGGAARVQGQGPLFPSNFARLRKSFSAHSGGVSSGRGTGDSARARHGPVVGRKPYVRLRDAVAGAGTTPNVSGGQATTGSTYGVPSAAYRQGKVRTYSHGASTLANARMEAAETLASGGKEGK
ncbi:hypothetical protein D9613_007029 [Agrocybe pediades]|uniref:Uncharacterized protein n=1 Tax=Agrocybe pediades TaxID=84607 RepID=A0A8H4QGX7_9AGAR|nr:hypothetical protein D9613_007029 [Agrocybe pediades]